MRVLSLALTAALCLPAAAQAQSTAQQMLDMAARIRASAQATPGLGPDDRAQMIRQAEEVEKAVREGAYGPVDAAPPKKEPTLEEALMARHGRLDWLTPLAACAGYTQENYLTFRYSAAINDRDSHCRNAYGHWATYLRVTRAGDAEAAGQALFYYNAAAERAAGLSGGK
ncbi:MAG: hypothetical protein JNK30_08830 [Phenylobacterium sp.]|uniref:hypothetical protein n=1 Tax=Phenylobacterium sp. TaxID=1871053 RepID=UPI001A4FF512|nr:hypothetical protein [Phenylobacterium sp.]MBL8771472.1 hypothetical protein [Phenylobacterium sp.]